ncbi:hypothetical protein MC885_000726 [Smutsia gigantea]|nr:hypothetical protein MC885_000726 [Smutsia gigantea]
MGAAPWDLLLTLSKQLRKSAMVKRPGTPSVSSQGRLARQQKGKEEELEAEDSLFELCVPGIVTPQSPLYKTFKPQVQWVKSVPHLPSQSALRPRKPRFGCSSWVQCQLLPPGGATTPKMTTRDGGIEWLGWRTGWST